MERSNQQTTDIPSSTRATAMRAGVQNPSGSNYQVAGPTIGGTATPYNPANIEVAKEHLADSLGRTSLGDNTTTTTTTGTTTTTYGTDSTLKDQVISGASTAAHTAADVTMTVAAGAAAAGAATVSAVKGLFAADKTDVDHSNPASTTDHTAMGATKSQPIADFPDTQVHNMHVDSTPETPTRMHTHAATGPIHSVPVDFEPIHSTGLDSTASMTDYRAKKADPNATSGVRSSGADVHPTTELNQGYNNHHARPSASAVDAIDARPTTASTTTTDSRPLTEKVTAPIVGAATAMGAAAAGTAAYLGNKASEAKESVKETANNLTTPSAPSVTPSSNSSYATMDSSKAYYNPSVSSSTSYTSPDSATTPIQSRSTNTTAPIQSQSANYNTTASTNSRPLTEKDKAPVAGAATAMGATAAGTAAYLGYKASEAKEPVKGSSNNNNTYSTSTPMNTPTAKTPGYTTARDATPATASSDPMLQTTPSAIKSVAPVTEPVSTRSPALDPYQTKATTTNPSSSLDSRNVTTSSSRPMTEKASAPVLGAAALGTAAYLGNKATATDANNSNKMFTPSANNTRTTASYDPTNISSYKTPNAAPTSYSTSSNTAPTSYTTPSNTAPTSYTTPSNTAPTSYTNPSNTAPTSYSTSSNTAPTSYTNPSNTAPTSYSTSSNTAPTSYTTPSNTTIPAHEKSTTTRTYPSTAATAAAPAMAAASVPYMSNTGANTNAPNSSATPNERKSADINAAPIPASYHGSIPKAGPGEEVVWVKTVTTTDYYDDGTSAGRADVVDRHQEPIDPRAYATVKDAEKVYDNNDQHMHQQEHKDQDDTGRHL